MDLDNRLMYKKDKENKVVDALSKSKGEQEEFNAISKVTLERFTEVKASYIDDIETQELIKESLDKL